jgi:hypothetical protein
MQHLQRPLASCLRALDIDLFDPLGHVSEHDHLIRKHVHEATVHGKGIFLNARPRPQLSDSQLRDERGMIGKNAQLSIDAGRKHNVHVATEQLFVLGHHLQS